MIFSSPFDDNSPRIYRISSTPINKDFKVLEIGYNRVPSSLRQVHKRAVYILHYVISGEGNFCGKDFCKGFCYTVFPNQIETIVSDKDAPYESYWIMLEGLGAGEILKKCSFMQKNDAFLFERTKQCAEILRETLFDINPANDIDEAYYMHSAFYRIMAEHSRNCSKFTTAETIAQKVKNFIDQNFQKDITVDNISETFNFSRNYLFSLFKKEYGISPKTYIGELRIKKAKELLKTEKNLNISEIAFSVGYKDPLYFSRIFYKKIGLSPKYFRNNHKN